GHEIHDLGLRERSGFRRAHGRGAQGRLLGRLQGVHAGADGRRRHGRGCRPAAAAFGYHGAAAGRQAAGAGRPLRRGEGAGRRLLRRRRAESRPGPRVGGEVPCRVERRRRGAAEPRHVSHQAAELAARASYGKLVAYLSAWSRDVAAAEDALGDAFLEALETWPRTGVPDKPEAWLLTVARRRLIDSARHAQVEEAAATVLRIVLERAEREASANTIFPDTRLALLFVCAHPAIGGAARTPLMLQTVLGLDAARISRAFLVAPATIGQRLVRVKAKIRDAGIHFEVPGTRALSRLDSVLEAIYAAYGSG